MKNLVRQAFLAVRDGYSSDRVVADPELNTRYLAECRRLGLSESDVALNQCLLNLRKGSDLSDVPRSRRTSFKNEEDYRFASEIPARYLERAKGLNTDRIICDPGLVREFDEMASQLAPGYKPVQYRWAALNLRKSKRLAPELLARVAPQAETVSLGRLAEVDVAQISGRQGLYIFYDPESKQTLYVGEAENLRKRLAKHLDHSDIKSLAYWLWSHGSSGLFLELHLLPNETSTKVRRALEAELIRTRNPLFNIQRPLDAGRSEGQVSISRRSLRYAGLYEAELLLELMLRFWEHPLAAEREFRHVLLEKAAEALRLAADGQQLIEGLPAKNTNLVAAIWYVEWCALSDVQGAEAGNEAGRQRWLEAIRRALPSCFCDPALLE